MPKSKNKFSLTEREKDIMKILWESNKPLIASDITKKNESLNTNTVQAVIRKLLDKGCIEVAEIVYSGTVLTRSYAPIISKRELLVQNFVNQLHKEKEEVPIPGLVATLLKHEKNESEVLEQLENLLKERRKSLNQEES
jgi:predicted transcriptional regulator